MISGFILVSVLCLEGGTPEATIAGVPTEKVSCSSHTGEVFKTLRECEAKAATMTKTIRSDYEKGYRELVISPGSACVYVNKKISERIQYGTDII